MPEPNGKLPNMEGACSAWLHGISDTGTPTVHFVHSVHFKISGITVTSHSTFQMANVPKDRPTYSTEYYALRIMGSW